MTLDRHEQSDGRRKDIISVAECAGCGTSYEYLEMDRPVDEEFGGMIINGDWWCPTCTDKAGFEKEQHDCG